MITPRTWEAAVADAHQAVAEFDNAREWLRTAEASEAEPLATEVWVFDTELTHVLMVSHRWRGWVSPGGAVEPGETPREGASRELFEETGVRAELLAVPAAVTVRSYGPDLSATLGLTFVAVVGRSTPLTPEDGQPAAWLPLDADWQGWFPEDRLRMTQHIAWITQNPTRTEGVGSTGGGGR